MMATIRRFWPLILVLAVLAAVFALGLNRYLSFEAVLENGERLKLWTDRHWWLGLILLMTAFAVLTASVTPGVFFLTILSGFLYGPWVGGVATSAAATLGALAVYWVGHTAARDSLRRWLERRGGIAQRVCERIDQDTFAYVLAARLVVSVPFHLINVAAGVMAAPLRPYLLATFIGVLPAHLIYCWIGSRLGELTGEGDIAEVMGRFALPLLGVAFLSLGLPLLMRLWRRRVTPAEDSSPPPPA